MKRIFVAALSVILVVSVSLYFGSSTTGLFYSDGIGVDGEDDASFEKDSTWELVGKIEVSTGNVSVLDS